MKVLWIGWNLDTVLNHDKVWGIGQAGDQYLTFWGRRGKKLQQNKKYMSDSEARSLIRSKMNKGYIAVEQEDLNSVYERFEKDLFVIALRA